MSQFVRRVTLSLWPFINIKRRTTWVIPNLQLWYFFKRVKNECETAVVNEPSVFESLKVYGRLL